MVAQLSQNMNFVMDLSVKDFLMMYAESRVVKNPEKIVENIFSSANDLAGEIFSSHTPLTELSGGQSRALMVADTALLSKSPIILISTHDPVIALSASRRIIIKNRGIKDILTTSEEEKTYLTELKIMDKKISDLRQTLRTGKEIKR